MFERWIDFSREKIESKDFQGILVRLLWRA